MGRSGRRDERAPFFSSTTTSLPTRVLKKLKKSCSERGGTSVAGERSQGLGFFAPLGIASRRERARAGVLGDQRGSDAPW